MDNYWILGKSVEIKVSSKMAGYKMNLPFNAGTVKYTHRNGHRVFKIPYSVDIDN